MGNIWVTDITHFLKADGSVPDGLAGRIARYFGSIVMAGSRLPSGLVIETDIQCRRRPKRRRCPGRIRILRLENPSRIEWRCPLCDDQGIISNWEGSRWDASGPQDSKLYQ